MILPVRLTCVAFLDLGVVAEEHGADLIFVEVHGETGNAVGELDELACHDLVEAVDAGDAVTERDHGTDFVDLDLLLVVFNLLAKQLCYLICVDLCHVFLLLDSYQSLKNGALANEIYAFTSFCLSCCNWARMEPSYTVEPMRTTAPPNSVASWR